MSHAPLCFQTDNRRVIGQNGISAENSSVTVVNQTLDAEVANHAFDAVQGVADRAISASTKDLSLSLDFAKYANSKALDSLTVTGNLVKDAYADAKGRGALTDKILIGAIVMAGVVALAAVKH